MSASRLIGEATAIRALGILHLTIGVAAVCSSSPPSLSSEPTTARLESYRRAGEIVLCRM